MKVENDIRQPHIQQKQIAKTHNSNLVKSSLNNNLNSYNPNFTGGLDLFLRFLDTNQAWGANLVDLGFMVTPRTITDFTRGVDAGTETLRREGSGTANHSMIGLYGSFAGLLLASGLNTAYGLGKNNINASSIFADTETIDLQGKIYNEKLKAAANNPSANPLREYLTETLKNYEGMSGYDANAQGKPTIWKRFDNTAIEDAVSILEKEIKSNGKKLDKNAAVNIRSILVSNTGLENTYRIVKDAVTGREHSSRYSIDSIIENMYKLGKVFSVDSVKEAFNNSADIAQNTFLKSLKSMNLKRSLAGIGIASVVGVSTQPLNMYLTKRKTGKSGFVGGGEEDKSAGFKMRKALVAGLFGAGVLATIGNPKNLMKNLQFKGLSPTINQFKFIYGITIMSRFLSARNDNELKEATFKDVLGFANWLLLGNFVQKLVAQSFDKSLIKKSGEGIMKWITGSVLKSRDEVLFEHLGKRAFDKDGKALGYSAMKKLADTATKTKIRKLSIAQCVGYAYSGLVLGIGIPKLNIILTKRRMAKQEAAKQAAALQYGNNSNAMLKPENRQFLESKFTGNAILG